MTPAEKQAAVTALGIENAELWPLSLQDTQRIVEHLMRDGTRQGLILADRLNSAMGAGARRRAEREATT